MKLRFALLSCNLIIARGGKWISRNIKPQNSQISIVKPQVVISQLWCHHAILSLPWHAFQIQFESSILLKHLLCCTQFESNSIKSLQLSTLIDLDDACSICLERKHKWWSFTMQTCIGMFRSPNRKLVKFHQGIPRSRHLQFYDCFALIRKHVDIGVYFACWKRNIFRRWEH